FARVPFDRTRTWLLGEEVPPHPPLTPTGGARRVPPATPRRRSPTGAASAGRHRPLLRRRVVAVVGRARRADRPRVDRHPVRRARAHHRAHGDRRGGHVDDRTGGTPPRARAPADARVGSERRARLTPSERSGSALSVL